MEDVAYHGYRQPRNPAEVLTDGEDIQKPLGGVLVWAIPGVDHGTAKVLGQKMRSSRRAVTDDYGVDSHGLDVLAVSITVSPFRGCSWPPKINDVGTQPAGRQPETRPRPCGILEE